MGNSLPQLNSLRSMAKNGTSKDAGLKATRRLRQYTHSASLLTSCITSHADHRHITFSRSPSSAPTDAEVIDVYDSTSSAPDTEHQLIKHLDYIHSCVRKDKGLFGKMTANLQGKHIFACDEPENTHTLERTPDDYHMDYQSIYLQTPDGEFIHAFWIHQAEEVNSHRTLLYFHGAGGNISHRLEVIRLFYDNLNCNVLIIDYRGKKRVVRGVDRRCDRCRF